MDNDIEDDMEDDIEEDEGGIDIEEDKNEIDIKKTILMWNAIKISINYFNKEGFNRLEKMY